MNFQAKGKRVRCATSGCPYTLVADKDGRVLCVWCLCWQQRQARKERKVRKAARP